MHNPKVSYIIGFVVVGLVLIVTGILTENNTAYLAGWGTAVGGPLLFLWLSKEDI